MALRDTWHRALVYFGLAEDHDYGPEYEEDFEPETGAEDAFGEPPRVRLVAARPLLLVFEVLGGGAGIERHSRSPRKSADALCPIHTIQCVESWVGDVLALDGLPGRTRPTLVGRCRNLRLGLNLIPRSDT